jgi:hypothetical protein
MVVKLSFFNCHWRFLSSHHRHINKRKDFLKGKVERDVSPSILSGKNYMMLSRNTMTLYLIFDLVSKTFLFWCDLYLSKIEFFFFLEFSYWNTNSIHHNLDVIHIKKNIFKKNFNMILDIKEKTKNSIKAWTNIVLLCDHQIIELLNDEECVAKSKVVFALDNNT